MCLISLSLSLTCVLDFPLSWCIASFLNIVGSYGVFPSLSCCDELSYYLWGFTIIELNIFMDLRALDVCLAMNTRGDNGVSYWFAWYMFWYSTCGFPRWHWGKLCIGVDAHFRPCFSGRNLGALFEVLCVGLSIMNLNLLWCYFSTNSWKNRLERIASRWFRTLQMISSYVLR